MGHHEASLHFGSPRGKLPPGTTLIKKGPRHTIAAHGDRPTCAVIKELARLALDDPATHTKILRHLDRTINEGPPLYNENQCRALQGKHADGIYEFKANSLRLLWFYLKNQRGIIICAYFFHKGRQKTEGHHIRNASVIRKLYDS